MKKISLSLILLALATPMAALAQVTVFQDTFGTSILNPTNAAQATPTATSTAYEIASSKNSTTSTNVAGTLTIASAATGSGFIEAQALFTTTPVTLAGPGQYIEMYYTFTDTNNVFNGAAATAAYLVSGFYNSGGGSGPTNGALLWNSGLLSSVATAVSGACKSWAGYTSEFSYSAATTQSSVMASRPAQTGANNLNQGLGYGSGEALGANLSTVLAGQANEPLLVNNNQYTVDLKISYVNATTIAITNTLFTGAGNTGPIFSAGGWTGQFGNTVASPLTTTFDGLEVGARANGSVPFNLLVNKITVVANGVSGPSFTVTGGGTGCPDSSFSVGLNGSVTTNSYYLLTNGVVDGAESPVTGTGSALNFGPQPTPATYTVLASNSVTKFTALMSGSAVIGAVPGPCISAPVVFSDNFNAGSTANGTSTPGGTTTASSTSYDLASGKTATNSISSGNFQLGLSGATVGGFYEAQAVFAASPVTLGSVGDRITFTYIFTDTSNLLAGGTASGIYAGLYNSGGSLPVAGTLANAGVSSTSGSAYATGNCANWQGYVSSIVGNGGNAGTYTRPVQNGSGTASSDQDLVIDSGSASGFGNPVSASLGTETSGTVLTNGEQYTLTFSVALTAAATLTITNNLYDGLGNLIFSQTNTAATTNVLTQSFDSLAFGAYNNGTSYNPEMDINEITVSASIGNTPGPSFTVTGGGLDCAGSQDAVGLSGSVSYDNYLLYTNGVYAGVTETGNGSAISFPMETISSATLANTVVASNTVSAITGVMDGSALVGPLPAPGIAVQPAAALAATNSGALFAVSATGIDVTYQWYRNGVKLTDANEISGSATSNLFIYPATTADAAAAAQGYYCLIANPCGTVVATTTNSLTLQLPGNIVWQGGNPNTNWDLATTANFTNLAGAPVVFHGGDNVTFDDSSAYQVVTLAGNYLTPTTFTDASQDYNYFFTGSGVITGTGALVMNGADDLTISNANAFSGGTTINSGTVTIRNFGALGSGAVTLAGGTLELPVAGSASTGLTNNLNVTANSTLQYDQSGTYGAVLYGALTGNAGATLNIYCYNGNSGTARVRLENPFTNSVNLNLNSLGAIVELAPYNASGSQVYNGVISGYGHFTPRGNGSIIFNNAANTFYDPNNNSEGVILSGSNLGLGADSASSSPPNIDNGPIGTGSLAIDPSFGSCSIFASGGAHTVGNPIEYLATNAMVLTLGSSNALTTLSGAFQLSQSSDPYGTNRSIQVPANAQAILSGVVSDNGLGSSLTKSGAGTLYLDGADTYTGSTTNSAGLLAGMGSLDGAVCVLTNASIGGGSAASIGTLTISGNLTLSGGAFIRVNKALTPGQSNDVVSVSGVLTNTSTGTVTVTNLGASLIAIGDRFWIFSEAVSNGAALTVAGGGMNWTNRLAVDGSIQALSVVSTVNTNATNITFSVSGNTLALKWPADHTGWRLLVQTDSLASGLNPATNAWATVPGSTAVDSTNITIIPTNGPVFYRLVYP